MFEYNLRKTHQMYLEVIAFDTKKKHILQYDQQIVTLLRVKEYHVWYLFTKI